ncbi:hypothetical protein EON64_09785 [archaeon]|nr:MAG: hypothetical protein EON64_09785 [archaeon]
MFDMATPIKISLSPSLSCFSTYRYSEMTDTKDFFNAAKKSRFMVVHFYRPVTPRCQIVDAHFQKLAPQHMETRFVKIDAEKNPFLVERLGIIIMPTIGRFNYNVPYIGSPTSLLYAC